jgi:hypothetical protein
VKGAVAQRLACELPPSFLANGAWPGAVFLRRHRRRPRPRPGLLAVAGIQNLVRTDPAYGAVAIARLSAEDAESALGRVRSAFDGEPFTVEEAVPEG